MIHRTKRNHTERKKDSREKRVYIKEEKDSPREKRTQGRERTHKKGKRICSVQSVVFMDYEV